MTSQIHGYTYDENPTVSPVSKGDLDLLLSTLLWTEDDADALSKAGGILEPQIDDILDLWYGYVGSNPHLVASFNGANGEPAGDYLAAVRLRFAQWIRDLCNRPWDQQWLNYQHEVGRRHVVTMGDTDDVASDQTHALPHRVHLADHGDDPTISRQRRHRRIGCRRHAHRLVQGRHLDGHVMVTAL